MYVQHPTNHVPDVFEAIPDFISVKQFREIFGLSRATVYRYVETGRIPAVRIGNNWRIPKKMLVDSLGSGCYDGVRDRMSKADTGGDKECVL